MKHPSKQGRSLSSLANGIGGALLAFAALLSSTTWALPDDKEQPIHITADQALRDEAKGHTVYSGNVRMVQGSMELEADRLTIWHQSEDADKIVARGQPARFRQQPEVDQDLVHAQADVITYRQRAQSVNLKTNARIEQQGDVVTGETIDYYIERQLIKAASSQREDRGDRVKVVIQPATQQGERPAPPAPAPVATESAPEPEPEPATTTPGGSTPSATEQDEEPSGAPEGS